MAKIVYLCMRDPQDSFDFKTGIELLNRRLIPDNIIPNQPVILREKGIWAGILNPTIELLTRGASICSGFPIFIPPDWWKPGGGDPDGSYGLFRSDDRYLELGTDISATRTIWYCQTERFFIASSSQRAIVAFLGDFQVNRSAFPYMLASGVLGPNNSWDRRINHLEADAHLLLDRRTWQITRRQREFESHAGEKSRAQYKQQLHKVMSEVFAGISFDPEKWVLSLSGGLDSRGILAFLRDRPGIRTVTWGTRASLDNPHSDAIIAGTIAKKLNARHQFFETDPAVNLDGDAILNRFVEAGEGRVDQLGGYRDGFLIWKMLFENGTVGYIRGDEFMGLKHPVMTAKGVFLDMNFNFLSDYANVPSCSKLGLAEQVVPEKYMQRPGESYSDWASRIRFNIKKVIEVAALNEIKTCYFEVMSPLLSRRVVDIIKTIPISKNRNKSIFRDIVNMIIPGIEYAAPSDQSVEEIIREPLFEKAVRAELESGEAQKWLPENLIDFLQRNLEQPLQGKKVVNIQPLLNKLKKWAPELTILTSFLRRKIYLDGHLAAFRGFIIARSCEMLNRDAELFKTAATQENKSEGYRRRTS